MRILGYINDTLSFGKKWGKKLFIGNKNYSRVVNCIMMNIEQNYDDEDHADCVLQHVQQEFNYAVSVQWDKLDEKYINHTLRPFLFFADRACLEYENYSVTWMLMICILFTSIMSTLSWIFIRFLK